MEEPTADTITAASVPTLVQKYGLAGGFDYAKLDIEGAEWTVFADGAAADWLSSVRLLSLEVHNMMAKPEQVRCPFVFIMHVRIAVPGASPAWRCTPWWVSRGRPASKKVHQHG